MRGTLVPLLLVLASLRSAFSLHIAVTGTNSGIGQSAARMLTAQGHTIYHACRTAEGAQAAAAEAQHQVGEQLTLMEQEPRHLVQSAKNGPKSVLQLCHLIGKRVKW